MRRLTAVALVFALVIIAGVVSVTAWALWPGGNPDSPAATGVPQASRQGFENADTTGKETVPAAIGAAPEITRIPLSQWRQIRATGTWRPGCPVGRKDLRRLAIGYIDFDGKEQRGVIVSHRDSVEDLAEIFTALYEASFPIAKMEPVEGYGGDVLRSLRANNTSAFNCRKSGQINAPVGDSPHANGRAIDINPVQNPWRDPRCDCWEPSAKFASAKEGPGVIRKGSLPVRLFKERGWIWQNIKVPDYMHFDTGYPSRPRTGNNSG